MNFEGKKIVITGASPDFGQTLSILFAKMGAELFLSARTLEKANATAEIIKNVAPSAKVTTFQANVSKPEDITKFAENVKKNTPEIDILINNASLWSGLPVTDASDDEIVEVINSTATGSILITKHFLPLLKKSLHPDIVFINSTAGLINHTNFTINEAFSAAKSAQSVFADRLRHRMKGSGIRFITIYPPNFDNPSPLDEEDWRTQRSFPDFECLTARNIVDAVTFSLSQDRVCSIDKIVLSNNI